MVAIEHGGNDRGVAHAQPRIARQIPARGETVAVLDEQRVRRPRIPTHLDPSGLDACGAGVRDERPRARGRGQAGGDVADANEVNLAGTTWHYRDRDGRAPRGAQRGVKRLDQTHRFQMRVVGEDAEGGPRGFRGGKAMPQTVHHEQQRALTGCNGAPPVATGGLPRLGETNHADLQPRRRRRTLSSLPHPRHHHGPGAGQRVQVELGGLSLDRPQTCAGRPLRRVAVAPGLGQVGDAGPAVDPQNLDAGAAILLERAHHDLAAAAGMSNDVLRNFAHHDRHLAALRLVEPRLPGERRPHPPRFSDQARVAHHAHFRGPRPHRRLQSRIPDTLPR